jgi:hypothetical protein
MIEESNVAKEKKKYTKKVQKMRQNAYSFIGTFHFFKIILNQTSSAHPLC